MTDQYPKLTLDTIAGGAVPELFERELQNVMDNIRDYDTDPEAKRSITIKVTFAPVGDKRSVAGTDVSVTSKLAPPAPVDGMMWLGRRDGALVAVTQNPQQGDMFDEDDADVTPIDEAARDGTHDDG